MTQDTSVASVAASRYAELGRRVLEAAPVVILVLDCDGRIEHANPYFERLTGYRLDEIRGKDWFDTFLPGRDHERIRAVFRECVRGRHVRGNVNPIVTRSGDEREIEWTDELLLDDEGRATGVLVIGHDVTERKRAEAAARRTSELLRTVVAGAPIVLFALDRNGVFTVSEGRALEKLGLKPGEMVGASALEVYADVSGLPDAFRRALAGEQTVHSSRVGGTDFEVVYAPSIDAKGQIDGVIGVAFDVTEHRRAEAQLEVSLAAQQRLVDELREADRRKDDFIAVLSHELRNPLSAIHGGVHFLRAVDLGNDKARRMTDIIERQVSHLARLVDDLLDVSRITQNKIRLQRALLDFGQLVRQAVDDHRALFEARGVRIEVAITGSPVVVNGDAARLMQVVGNLLQNAVKFTPSGGLATVSVSVDPRGDRAVLCVADTGVGIEPAMIGRMFEPFAQADRSLARSKGGLGLGLALVKGLIELHGGDVGARSEGPDRGTEIVVRLPLEQPAASSSESSVASERAAHRSRRVLVIEDNVDAAEALRTMLELYGHSVELEHDAAAGVRRARELRPEIVLCDLGLPGMSGFDVARELRRDEALRSTRLVAVSGYAASEDVAQARAAGFDHHFGKPLDLERLRRVLDAER